MYREPVDLVCGLPSAVFDGGSTVTLRTAPGSVPNQRYVPASDYVTVDVGAVAERTKATALKVVGPQGPVGSNPTRSAHHPLRTCDVARHRGQLSRDIPDGG